MRLLSLGIVHLPHAAELLWEWQYQRINSALKQHGRLARRVHLERAEDCPLYRYAHLFVRIIVLFTLCRMRVPRPPHLALIRLFRDTETHDDFMTLMTFMIFTLFLSSSRVNVVN